MRFLILFLMIILSFAAPVYAGEDEFPEGMNEGEKRQMLDEMYEDIEKDEDFEPPKTDINAPLEDEKLSDKYNNMTDEQIRDELIKMMPDSENLEEFSDVTFDRVMVIAKYDLAYDRSKNLYRYLFSDGRGFSLSVPMGGWSDRSVAVIPDEEVTIVAVEKDGADVSGMKNPDGSFLFRDPGRYSFQVSDPGAGAVGMVSGSFRIYDPARALIDSFVAYPEGYSAKEIYLDGVLQRTDMPSFYRLKEDGVYEFDLCSTNKTDALPDLRLIFKRDTTPPVIDWEGDVRGGQFTGEVTYSLPEDDTEVNIWYNGQRAYSESRTLAAAGNYYITAADPAGNIRSYSFVVKRKGRIPWVIVAIVSGVLAITAGFVVYSGTRSLRVK